MYLPLTTDQQKREEKPLTADQERKAFQLAMRDGVSNSLSFRLCVFGPENSGKTCLVDTLFDDIFQQQEATKGADVNICTIYATNWQKCTPQQMADNIQTQFFHGLNISAKQQVESPSFQATSAVRKTGFLSKFKAVLIRSNPSGSSQLHKAPEVKLEEIKQAKAIKIVSEKEFTAIVWDFAGQIQYLSTHTVFVRRDNVVFIVFKASCHLSDIIKARPGDEDSASSCKPTTYFHVIHYWLQTVTSVCHDTSGPDHMSEFLPTAVLIATHIDEIIGDLEQAKEAIVAQLAWELEGKPYAKHLVGNLPGVGLLNALRKFCIFLSNKVRDENVITQLKEIVLQISAPSMKEKHPLIYLKIEKELLLLRKEVITTKEFHKVAVENGFMAEENSMEMKGALDHFHQKGVILHFPSIDSLNQLVFLSPQWLEKLIAFLVIACHYKPMGDKDDHSYRHLKHEGVLVGSFLLHSLEMFNKFHKVIGCEISFNQAIAFLTKFGFIAEISITTEFLEESHPWSEEETRIFIVPSQLPEGKGDRKSSFAKEKHVWSISFAFIDGFIPLTIFYQMIATCINWNESRKQNIVWYVSNFNISVRLCCLFFRLQKYEIMMVLNHGQYYSVSLCEEKSTIQVDIILGKSMKKSAENRKLLIGFFQTTLEKICHDIIPASSKPIPYIQCPHCDQAHLKLRNLLEEREMFCNMVPVHQDYYQDLFRECQGTLLALYYSSIACYIFVI